MSLIRDRFVWRHGLVGAFAVALTLSLPVESEAKRVGGGGSYGMKRAAQVQSTPATPPKQASQPQSPSQSPSAAQAAPAAGAAAAAPAARSWMGPIAGLAAGLGLAALMSHLGMGEAFANFLMLALLGVAAFFLVAFLMRRFGRGASAQPAAAAAGGGVGPARAAQPHAVLAQPATHAGAPTAMQRTAFVPAAADVSVTGRPLGQPPAGSEHDEAASAAPVRDGRWTDPLVAPTLPQDFDLPAFERVAKMIFIRLQAANDAGDLDDLRTFTTPEMFSALRLDLQERGGRVQRTDVERVEASVVDFATETGRHVVSVRFQGLIREEEGADAEAFDEVWHLVKPESEGGSWAIAGIQQSH